MVKLTYANQTEQDDEPNWALSMAAAVPSGIIKIGEGVATLGAALLDLGVDEDRVEAVEQYFDDINPFDELADLQALIWYPEKRLYDAAKLDSSEQNTGYQDNEAPDYVNAAANLVATLGIQEADIQSTLQEVDNELERQAIERIRS